MNNIAKFGSGLLALTLTASMAFVGAAQAADAYQPSVLVFNQKAGTGNATITYAFIPKDGFVALYAGDPQTSKTMKPIGEAALLAGDNRDLHVTLPSTAKAGEKLWAELRVGTITNLGASKPVMLNGEPVEQSFVLK